MVPKTALMMVLVLGVFAASIVPAKAVGESDMSNCTLAPPDYVPDRMKKCFMKFPISCQGKTLMYRQTDVLPAIPCILGQYGLKGFWKLQHCGYDVAMSIKPGLKVHIDEDQLIKFYRWSHYVSRHLTFLCQ